MSVPSCWLSAGISRSPLPSADKVKSASTLYPTLLPVASSSRSQISATPMAFPAGGTQTTLKSVYFSTSARILAICSALGCAYKSDPTTKENPLFLSNDFLRSSNSSSPIFDSAERLPMSRSSKNAFTFSGTSTSRSSVSTSNAATPSSLPGSYFINCVTMFFISTSSSGCIYATLALCHFDAILI